MVKTCSICGALTNKPKKHKRWHDNGWIVKPAIYPIQPLTIPSWPTKPTVTWTTNTTST